MNVHIEDYASENDAVNFVVTNAVSRVDRFLKKAFSRTLLHNQEWTADSDDSDSHLWSFIAQMGSSKLGA